MRILVVESRRAVRCAVACCLGSIASAVDEASTAEDGRRLAATGDYQLIILDTHMLDTPMGKSDTMTLPSDLRTAGVRARILLLSPVSSRIDLSTSYQSGADDLLGIPFEFDELLSRAQMLLRRGDSPGTAVLRCGDLELDPVCRRGQTLRQAAQSLPA